MVEKKFFRVRLSDKCPAIKKMVNGVMLTKRWQMKTGEVGDFDKFPDVEVEVMVKQGNGFVSAGNIDTGAADRSGGISGQFSGSVPTPAKDAEGTKSVTGQDSSPNPESTNENSPNFNSMTVEQLKTYLIAKGISSSELRSVTKPELIERAEFIWSQN